MPILTYDEYYDKVLGGWTGKCLGGTVGRFEGTKELTKFNIYELLPEGMVPNDDLDVQLIWLDVLLDKGIHLTSAHLMEAWLKQYDYNMGEYGFSRRNSQRGIMPPNSGIYANDFYKDSMGCPIRSEVWGMICPGNPKLAATYAYKDACLDHEGESIWAEQFLSAMEAAAFFESDVRTLIYLGLKYIPPDSRLFASVMEAMKGYDNGLDWEQTWMQLRSHHSHPDCTYAPMNMGIIVMALLYGVGCIEKTLTIAVNSGWDVDCTCASVAALIGIIKGRDGIDEKLLEKMGDKVITVSKVTHKMDDLSNLTDYTCSVGVTLIDEGLSDVTIHDIPAKLHPVPTANHRQEMAFIIDYKGSPAIGYMESKEISICAINHSKTQKTGVLRLVLPDGWLVDINDIPLTLTGGGKKEIYYQITVPEGIEQISDANILTMLYTEDSVDSPESVNSIDPVDSMDSWRYDFGLCGAPTCKVLGPFFDTYADWNKKENIPAERFLTTPGYKVLVSNSGEEWCNHKIDIDKEYILEEFSNTDKLRELFAGGARTSIYGDIYKISQVFGHQGPSCCYYLQEVYSPKDRVVSLVSGSSDPYKIWLNGELIYRQKENRFWLPINNPVVVNMKEGVNYIVLKVVRTGTENKLSLMFRKHEEGMNPEHDILPILTDLTYGTML